MAMVRVTQNMIVGGSTTRLQGSLSRLAELQEQLSSGRRLNRPSDSPTDTAQAMRLRGSLSSLEQYSRNAADGASRLGLADPALTTSTELVAHARELGRQGANAGSSSPASRAALATELDQVRASLLDQANTTYLSRPLSSRHQSAHPYPPVSRKLSGGGHRGSQRYAIFLTVGAAILAWNHSLARRE